MRKSKIKLFDNQIREVYFRILRDMILEIREHAYQCEDKTIYHKADLIHNIPYAFRADKTKSASEKLQASFDWFSIHVDYEGPHQKYVKSIIDQVMQEV